MICPNCALFGEHKGHRVEKLPDFILKLATLTDSTLAVFTEIKNKQEDLNYEVVETYINDSLNEHKQSAIKSIKNHFNRLVENLRKAEKTALAQLESEIKLKR